jgi:hypothetical protein
MPKIERKQTVVDVDDGRAAPSTSVAFMQSNKQVERKAGATLAPPGAHSDSNDPIRMIRFG